jgi:hypothetical protein
MDYDNALKSMVRNGKKGTIEPNMFIVGSLCLLQQFHPSAKLEFFGISLFTQPTSATTLRALSATS